MLSILKRHLFYSLALCALALSYSPLHSMNHTTESMDEQSRALKTFFDKDHFDQQVSNRLIEPDGKERKVIAAAFSKERDGHIGVAFDDKKVEVRNAKNTNNLIHSIEFHDPVYTLAFSPWAIREDLIMEQRSSTRSYLRLLDIYNKPNINIKALNSVEILHENLNAEVKSIVFENDHLGIKILDTQNCVTLFGGLHSSPEWKKYPPKAIDTLNNCNCLLSPLGNYQATIYPTDPNRAAIIRTRTQQTMDFVDRLFSTIIPTAANEPEENPLEKTRTITTTLPIESLVFSMDGEIIGIVTQLSQKNPAQRRVSLWESATGKFITDLDIANQQDIKSIQLNEDGREIIVIYNNETPALHITFDKTVSRDLQEKCKNDEALRMIIANAIAHKKKDNTTPYILSFKESQVWKTLSWAQSAFLSTTLSIRNTWSNRILRLATSPKTLAALVLYTFYLWWQVQNLPKR